MLVSMSLSETYGVPPELALLYDFVNTLDERRYVERGAVHGGGDEIATLPLLTDWMRVRGLLGPDDRVAETDHQAALDLRKALRDFLRSPPAQRSRALSVARKLSTASQGFPLALAVSDTGAVELVPAPGSSALGRVLAQMLGLARTDRLDRLKTCASDECHWIFFDRSKPANRHWCSSARCGNRQKTRTYRARRREGA
jgi:CGNR zinc finger/Putative stress-induced transcription regulator